MMREIENKIEFLQVDLNEFMFSKFNHYFYILSDEEQKKAHEFKIDFFRKCHLLSRITLRLLLSKYTGIAPELIKIHKNEYGKPFIKSVNQIRFNVSHSKERLVIVVAPFEVGIDIEYINPHFDINKILDLTLSKKELLNIKKLKGHLQRRQFYRHWTQKESLLKAMGKGLNVELNELEIFENYIKIHGEINKNTPWIVTPFNTLNKNYAGHVAYEHQNNKIIKHVYYDELDSVGL